MMTNGHQYNSNMSDSLQIRHQRASADFQKLQSDLSNAVEARQRLDAQLSENELVKKVKSIDCFCERGTDGIR